MKNPKAPQLVTVAIFTTITVIFWVFLSLYRILTTTPPPDVPPEILAPITPELDINVLESLPNRVFFEEKDVEAMAIPLPVTTLTSETTELPEQP